MPTILAVFALILGLLATLTMLVMLIAGSPNSSPETLATIKRLMLLTLAVGAAAFLAASWALVVDRPWLSFGLGISPVAFSAILTIVLVKAEI